MIKSPEEAKQQTVQDSRLQKHCTKISFAAI